MHNGEYAKRAEWKGWIVPAGIFLLIGLLLVFRHSLLPGLGTRMATKHPAVGHELPVLMLQPLTGTEESVSLGDLSGGVTLINFWGTWCPPCRVELPHLVSLVEKFRGKDGFRFLSVSCGPGRSENLAKLHDDTEAFLRRSGFNIPTYADADFASRRALEEIGGFDGYPTTLLLDRGCVVHAVWVGYAPEVDQQIETLLSGLLAEEASQP